MLGYLSIMKSISILVYLIFGCVPHQNQIGRVMSPINATFAALMAFVLFVLNSII